MTLQKLVDEMRTMHPLRFTPTEGGLWGDPRDEFYVFRKGYRDWRWLHYPKECAGWPDDAYQDYNVFRIPDGADPRDVADWLEKNEKLLDDWTEEKVSTKDVEDALKSAIKHEHLLDASGQSLREAEEEWKRSGGDGDFVDYVVKHLGGAIEYCEYHDDEFIRFHHKDWGERLTVWVPLSLYRDHDDA